MSFRVQLQTYRGPMDLLLYLVRRHEVDILNLPIAPITHQFLEYLTILEELDVNAVGDFVEVASLLIEIKSRSTLPSVEEEEETWEDPREDLVARLLEYKKYKDVSTMLEERGRAFQQSYSRLANDLPTRRVSPSEQPIREVELWDLVSALGRIIRTNERAPETNIVYDDTPIQTHMRSIHAMLAERGKISMTEVLSSGMPKSVIIGLFLAILELVRHHSVEAQQLAGEGEIWIERGENFAKTLELADRHDLEQTPGTPPVSSSRVSA